MMQIRCVLLIYPREQENSGIWLERFIDLPFQPFPTLEIDRITTEDLEFVVTVVSFDAPSGQTTVYASFETDSPDEAISAGAEQLHLGWRAT